MRPNTSYRLRRYDTPGHVLRRQSENPAKIIRPEFGRRLRCQFGKQHLKREGLRRMLVPYDSEWIHAELDVWVDWYNSRRPHSSLSNATPGEAHVGTRRLPSNLGTKCALGIQFRPRMSQRARFGEQSASHWTLPVSSVVGTCQMCPSTSPLEPVKRFSSRFRTSVPR